MVMCFEIEKDVKIECGASRSGDMYQRCNILIRMYLLSTVKLSVKAHKNEYINQARATQAFLMFLPI